MQEKLRKQVLNALLIVVRPVVKILLRYGIGYREFVEIVKTAFVDVASSDYGIRGRPTNISRVAVMTGLTRKEVRRLRDKIAEGGDRITVKTTSLSDVLHHWYAQDEFTSADGAPIALPYSGENGSFSSLVRRFGGDIPAGAMRTEMKRVGAVEEGEDGLLTIIERTFRPSEDHDTLVTTLIHAAYPVLSNIVHNTDPERTGDSWVNRVAFTRNLRPSEYGRFRRIAKDRMVEFVESIDDVFMAFESINSHEDIESDSKAVAIGVFYFEECDDNAKYDW